MSIATTSIAIKTQISTRVIELSQTTVFFGGSGSVWGAISGTLADQTDLDSVLGSKRDQTDGAFSVDINVAAGFTYQVDGQDVILVDPSHGSYFFGGAGNVTTTGPSNAALGGTALSNNTTGSNNAALGSYSLYSNTTGSSNAALGSASLKSNTTGSRNAALGVSALSNNTTGSNNAALGSNSLYNNTTGSNNVAVGQSAGFYYNNGGPNKTSRSSTYLGYGTRSLADGDENEIIIGYNAIGAGSNTATLGNTDTVKTVLRGAVMHGDSILAAAPAASANKGAHLNITGTVDGYAPCWSDGTIWINLITGVEIA